jgi:hypothetical protein
MARAAYVVRDDSPGGPSGNVDKLYPYTLKGDDGMRVIRRFERGREHGEADGGALQVPCS